MDPKRLSAADDRALRLVKDSLSSLTEKELRAIAGGQGAGIDNNGNPKP